MISFDALSVAAAIPIAIFLDFAGFTKVANQRHPTPPHPWVRYRDHMGFRLLITAVAGVVALAGVSEEHRSLPMLIAGCILFLVSQVIAYVSAYRWLNRPPPL